MFEGVALGAGALRGDNSDTFVDESVFLYTCNARRQDDSQSNIITIYGVRSDMCDSVGNDDFRLFIYDTNSCIITDPFQTCGKSDGVKATIFKRGCRTKTSQVSGFSPRANHPFDGWS